MAAWSGAVRNMRRLAGSFRGFVGAKSGSTAIEYTVITGLVSTAIVASLGMIAGPLGEILSALSDRFLSN